MKKRFVFGIVLILAGIILSLKSVSLTGNVIGGGDEIGSILGLALIIGGALICLINTETLEAKLFTTKKPMAERRGEEDKIKYWITDPEMIFSKIGQVSLDEFQKGMDELRGDPELFGYAEQIFGPGINKALEQKGEAGIGAGLFYDILYPPTEDEAQLPPREREEIKRVLRDFDPERLTRAQREMLSRYEIKYEKGRKHNKLVSPYGTKPVSHTPSAQGAVRGVTKDVLTLAGKYVAANSRRVAG